MRTIIITLMLLCSTALWAQKSEMTYNISRAIEAIQNNDYDQGEKFARKELDENPENGYALYWLAVALNNKMEYGQALSNVSKALKRLPSKEKSYTACAYATRAEIYCALKDTARGMADYAKAIKMTPEDARLYDGRAEKYYNQGKYDLADADYKKMIEIDEGNMTGYMGMGRNAKAQKRWDDAIKIFDFVTKLAPRFSYAYSFRAESYIGKKNYSKAIDDVITAVSLGDNQVPVQELADSALTLTVVKLKVQKNKEPNNIIWTYLIGDVYQRAEKYAEAIPFYKECLAKERNAICAKYVAQCYNQLGDNEKALLYCDQAIELDSTYYDALTTKASILYDLGETNASIAMMDKFISHNTSIYWGYRVRGWYKSLANDVDGAIEDYSTAISMNSEDAHCYLCRARMYDRKGDRAAAESDYKKVIELDPEPSVHSSTYYAYRALGQEEKAIEFMDKVIALDPDRAGTYYEAACLYSLMGKQDKALDFLETSLEKGYCEFAHIGNDSDMAPIRDTPRFKELIQKYKAIHQQKITDDGDKSVAYDEVTEEVSFTKDGTMCKVKCSINGLPLHFIFDTGASVVSISSVEASFMFKNDYLSKSDIVGTGQFINANGEISEGAIINLREVKFGECVLENVKASVVRNQSAPLLLGQSVLSKLGKIQIDNEKNILSITYKKAKE